MKTGDCEMLCQSVSENKVARAAFGVVAEDDPDGGDGRLSKSLDQRVLERPLGVA